MMADIKNPCPELWTLPGSLQGAIHPAQIATVNWQDLVRGRARVVIDLADLALTCKGFVRSFRSASGGSRMPALEVFDV